MSREQKDKQYAVQATFIRQHSTPSADECGYATHVGRVHCLSDFPRVEDEEIWARLQVVDRLFAQYLCCSDRQEAALQSEDTPRPEGQRHHTLRSDLCWRINKWLLHGLEVVTVLDGAERRVQEQGDRCGYGELVHRQADCVSKPTAASQEEHDRRRGVRHAAVQR
eukprot:CAMPEP_0174716396 /NCGR_PEP_ID=MMETSP1094-20130205/23991_2 /TAXON_ID=156173 /ORGANISM="Chrysochromulina brevifilum, Strain UTEX LB 985" /LENGTH=165 /DNA_ID=CAMNT_0015916137 /DNA_START=111 /DNA_END=604 /DNA_ORIENTATION=-